MEVIVVPMLSDNYSYLLVNVTSSTCAAIDPVEPEKAIQEANDRGLKITHVLCTHEHWDHSGGNLKMKEILGDELEIIGGFGDEIPGVTRAVKADDRLMIGDLEVQVIETPCHTPGHVSYYANSPKSTEYPGAVFTGDTLFVGGCGNFNSGTPKQMHVALQRLASLPETTLVYVGHEYTIKNLRWALVVEPENQLLKDQLAALNTIRAAGEPTVPSTIGSEKQTNPFVRAVTLPVQEWAGHVGDPVATLAKVRKEKDVWGRTH